MTEQNSIAIPYTDFIRHKKRARLLAPFSARHRRKRALLDLDADLSLALHHGITTPDGRFFYLKNAKAGCTTIAQLLHMHAFGAAYDGDIHRQSGLAAGIRHWPRHVAAIESDETVRFTFVRDPAARLRSAFFNFFVDCRNERRLVHWDNMIGLGFVPDGDIARNFDVFLDYVALNLAETERHCDPHWRGQWVSIGSGRIDYDFIGRLENFDRDIAEVFARAGLPDFAKRAGGISAYNRSSNGANGRLRFTRAQSARIRALYATDYDVFGYD